MSGFILNRGKSFAARYKDFESKPGNKNDVQQSQLKGCSKSADSQPQIVFDEDDDDDDIEIDLGLSTTPSTSVSGAKGSKLKGKRKLKKEKPSNKSYGRGRRDIKPTLLVPKFEADDSDWDVISGDDSNKTDSDGSNFSDADDSDGPVLDITVIDTNESNPVQERKTETITLKLKFNGKFHKFTVDYNERIFRHLNGFYKGLGVSKRTHELVITYNDKELTFNDTAKSLELTIVDYLEVYTRERSEPLEKTTKNKVHRDPNSIEIKVRNNQDGRHDQPLIMHLEKKGTLRKLMEQYAEIKKYDLSNLIFDFDGDKLTGEETPVDLDMENGSLIDVRITNK